MYGRKGRVGTGGGGREATPLFSPSKGNGDLYRMTSCVADPKVQYVCCNLSSKFDRFLTNTRPFMAGLFSVSLSITHALVFCCTQ